MEREKVVPAFSGRGGVQNRVAIDAAQPRRELVVGVNGGDLSDPCEVWKVEV